MAKLTFQQSLDLALDYIAFNPTRYIFPIKAGAKFPPLIKDNLEQASNDPKQIEEWARKWPGCNWGVAHRKSRLMVADIDVKPGKGGQATYDLLDLDYGWPETEMTRTPSGGFHKIYDAAERGHIFALGKFGFGEGVDSPNYTIIPGSQFVDGTAYVCERADPTAKAPDWFYDLLGRAKTRLADAGETAVDLDKDENVAWAKDFLENDAEPAIEGKSGDLQTVKIAMGLRDKGISIELAKSLMQELYNPRCIPPWEPDDLDRKVENGYAYANQSRVGDKTAEADFEEDADFDPETIKTEASPEQIAKEVKAREAKKDREKSRPGGARTFHTKATIIKNFAYIGTSFDIFIEKDKPKNTWKRGGFDAHFKYVQRKGKLSEALLSEKAGSIERYDSLVYQPGKPENVDGAFNLYRPSGVVPAEGDISWWDAHLEYLFPKTEDREHVLNWLAWFVQNIDRKPKHALLIQGHVQGTGKSFIPNMMRKIIGESNAANVTQTDLTSQFNGFAMRAKLLVIEELRAVERNEVRNRIHPMITEDSVSINEKNMPRFDMPNVFGFIAMTNLDAAISLDKTDRRYVVVRTDAMPKDPGYYQTLYAKLRDPDAIAAVAYSLMNRQLGRYSGAGPAPMTLAKKQMIYAGYSDLEQFMLSSTHIWPFNGRIVTIEDFVDAIPPEIARKAGRLRANVASAMREHFGAIELGQPRLSNGSRPRVYAINGSGIANIQVSNEKLAELYETDKRNQQAKAEKEFEESDDLSDLTSNPED